MLDAAVLPRRRLTLLTLMQGPVRGESLLESSDWAPEECGELNTPANNVAVVEGSFSLAYSSAVSVRLMLSGRANAVVFFQCPVMAAVSALTTKASSEQLGGGELLVLSELQHCCTM